MTAWWRGVTQSRCDTGASCCFLFLLSSTQQRLKPSLGSCSSLPLLSGPTQIFQRLPVKLLTNAVLRSELLCRCSLTRIHLSIRYTAHQHQLVSVIHTRLSMFSQPG